jgi:hypothetical protein
VEIGTEAVQFPEKEYINGIFIAVWTGAHYLSRVVILHHACFYMYKANIYTQGDTDMTHSDCNYSWQV